MIDTIPVEIPIEYVETVSIGAKGAVLWFDLDICPKDWDAVSITIDLETAIRFARAIGASAEVSQ